MRNGAGTYNLPQAPFTPGTVISSTAVNSNFSDIANALTQSLANDGQTVPTANLPMAGYRHTGVGNAVARTDYAAMGQVQDGAGIWCGTAGGTANALTLTPSPAITAYVAGQVFRFTAGAAANTGAATVAISGLTATAIQGAGGALTGGEIAAGRQYSILYDGANFQLQGFGTGTFYGVGISAGSLVRLDNSARLPAVDGSLLTNINSGAATITAGENLADRDLIYQDIFNQRGGGATRWYKVDTDATAPVRISPRLGIALAAITSGATGSAQVQPGRVAGFSGLTAGLGVWASATAGIVTQTEPAVPSSGTQNAVRLVGYAASATEIDFDPDAVTTFVARNSALAVAGALTVQHFTDSGARERIPHAYIAAPLFSESAAFTLDSGNFDNRNTYAYRQVIPASAISTSGSTIRVRLRASTVENLTFTTCRIQEKAGAGNDWDFASAGVTVTFNGGSDGGTVTAGSTLTSDNITFALDETKNYVVSFYVSGSGVNDGVRYRTTQTGCVAYEKIGSAADASATAPSGFSDSGQDVISVDAILVDTGTRAEPVTIGSETVNSAATDRVTLYFSDTSNANADTHTTAVNRTGLTRDLIVEVTL